MSRQVFAAGDLGFLSIAWNGDQSGCWVADKTGMGHEGRLLLGHAQQVRMEVPGAADGSLEGQHLEVRQPISGSGRPGGSGLAGPQVAVGFAGCVAFEAADDLGLGQAFFAPPGNVGAGGWV